MKAAICLIIILASINIYGQQEAIHFDKYAYQLIGFRRLNNGTFMPSGGSGFFYRGNNKKIFITAMHVLAGCVNDSTQNDEFADTLFINKSYESIPHYMWPIPTKFLHTTLPCKILDSIPDVIAIPMANKLADSIYSVEAFNRPPFQNFDSLIVFGYPSNTVEVSRELKWPNASFIKTKLRNNDIIRNVIINGVKDSINFWIKMDQPLSESFGFSGSPVFLKEKGSQKWRIMGILVGATENMMVVCPFNYAIDAMNRIDK